MKSLIRYLYRLFDKVLPPLRFNLNKKKKKKPTTEELDKWATDYIEKLEKNRRHKRGS